MPAQWLVTADGASDLQVRLGEKPARRGLGVARAGIDDVQDAGRGTGGEVGRREPAGLFGEKRRHGKTDTYSQSVQQIGGEPDGPVQSHWKPR